MEEQNKGKIGSVIATIVTVFMLSYGLHYFGYFIRLRYFALIDTFGLDEGYVHAAEYLGHAIFLILLLLYAAAVKNDRKYILVFLKGSPLRNIKYMLIGAVLGFVMMGTCILAASMNGVLTISLSSGLPVPLILFALFAVFVQGSTEEIESRAFVFGKMKGEGVPLIAAAIVSCVYFSYLHATNPSFGLIPFISICSAGAMFLALYYSFDNLWLSCTTHTMWNFTQDFLFGLPDSGKPAAASVFSTTANGSSSLFFDENFGIEGSYMAIAVNLGTAILAVLIGMLIRRNKATKSERITE